MALSFLVKKEVTTEKQESKIEKITQIERGVIFRKGAAKDGKKIGEIKRSQINTQHSIAKNAYKYPED